MAASTPDLRRWRQDTTTWVQRVRETVGLLALLFSRRRDRTTTVYDLLSSHNNLGEQSLYLNLGYWPTATTYDEACEALARLLATQARLAPGQTVLDAGFGFADQDLLWARQFGVQIVGVNLTASQVKVARERVLAAGLEARVDLRLRSALETGLEDESVDCVMALESAFHFPTRDAFFAEAHRVLRPGGRLALADLCTAKSPPRGLGARLTLQVAQASWQIPSENLYGLGEYKKRLRGAGFGEIEALDVSEQVFAPFGKHARSRQAEPDVVARANPLMRAVWRAPTSHQVFDYVVVTARKPVDPTAGPTGGPCR